MCFVLKLLCFLLPIILFTFPSSVHSGALCVPYNTTRNTFPRCGRIIGGINNGTIYYKPYHKIESNERCVWIIETGHLMNTVFLDILYLGFPVNRSSPEQPRLVVTSRNAQGEGVNKIVNARGPIRVDSTGPIVLTFSSGVVPPNSSDTWYNGFIMLFNRTCKGERRNSTIALPAVLIEHEGNFSVDAVALHVIPPSNNLFPGQGYSLQMVQRDNVLANCGKPYTATLYRYNMASPTVPWDRIESICDGTPTKVIGGHQELCILVFHHKFSAATFFNSVCEKTNTPLDSLFQKYLGFKM